MTSELFDPLFGRTAISASTDDAAFLAAMCEAETALARACARAGLIDLASALEIGAACEELGRSDPAELGRQSVGGGNPVIPLVTALRVAVSERAGNETAAAVHLGATSQDILDTAMMLIARRALGVIAADLADCAHGTAALARAHRDTPLAGRTLLRQAVATTFGALAAVWGTGLDRARDRLDDVRDRLPASLGGAAGTMSGLHPHGLDVLTAYADELGLAEPAGVWHGDRGVVAELAGVLGQAAAAVGKVAGDIVLLAQSELSEVRENVPGGSSAMAHKQNAIAAVTARAGAAQAPGLVATLLTAASPELQRGAGAWHAEWPALVELLRAVGGAASRLRASLTGLRVDTGAMARNLALLEGVVDVGDLGHAGDLVDRYLEGRTR